MAFPNPQSYLLVIDLNVDVDKPSCDNALINLLLNNEAQLEFELQMALSAYDNDNAPNPYAGCVGHPYYSHLATAKYYAIGRAAYLPAPPNVSEADLKYFFDSIRDVKAFVSKLRKRTQQPVKKYTITTRAATYERRSISSESDIDKLLSHKIFTNILYFTVFSSRVNLTDITLQITKNVRIDSAAVKVFTVTRNKNDRNKRQCIDGLSQYLFHGTSECNLYPILRYGISAMGRQGVWMTTNINTAWHYALSANKVFLVFEAKPQNFESRGSSIYEIAVNRINLKSIIWLRSDYSHNYFTVGSEVVKYLKQTNPSSLTCRKRKRPL